MTGAPEPAAGLVQVWALPVLPTDFENEYLLQHLSAEEKQRVGRLRQTRDKARHVVAHAGLRLILTRVFGLEPALIQFERGPAGKPYLAPASGQPSVHFNLSHSGELVLIATSTDQEVGIDVEALDRDLDAHFAATFCGPEELEWLKQLPIAEQSLCCYRFWAIKEAVVKASGSGLGHPLQELLIDLSSLGKPFVQVRRLGAQSWCVKELESWRGYVGAVASERPPLTLQCAMFPLQETAAASATPS